MSGKPQNRGKGGKVEKREPRSESKRDVYKYLRCIKGEIYLADYDGEIAIGIANRNSVEIVKEVLEKKYGEISLQNQRSKSLFDPRLTSVVFRSKEKKVLFKLWLIMDYELIPVIDNKVHIDVMLRLCFNEYIASDMLNLVAMADVKLRLFKRLLEKRDKLRDGKVLADPAKCQYVGAYCPLNIGLKIMKIDKLTYLRKKRLAEQG
jgi:hypothetical protein